MDNTVQLIVLTCLSNICLVLYNGDARFDVIEDVNVKLNISSV